MGFSRILITGCGGMLGSAIYPYFRDMFPTVVATDKVISEPWLQELDIRNSEAVDHVFSAVEPDLVLHLAAETDLEYCETYPDVAESTNSAATRNLAKLCEQRNITLVYISTAGVFDGIKEDPYTEQDEPKPIMVYGQTKFDGENHVRDICSRYYVVRAGWMVGGGKRKDHKFVSKIIEQIIDNESVIYAVGDKWGTPTYTHDFALNLFKLLDSKEYGTYHMVCEGDGTRYDVAKEILDICGREDIKLEKVDSSYFEETYFAPRPRSEIMINANLSKIGINLMRPWKQALYDYLVRGFPNIIARKDIDVDNIQPLYPSLERRSLPDRRSNQASFDGTCRRGKSDRRGQYSIANMSEQSEDQS
jgi:dTDP-4-dehydrorhamnose reductase